MKVFHEFYENCTKDLKIKKKYEGNCWISKEIRDEIKSKNEVWKKWRKNPTNEQLKKEFKNMRNKLNNKIVQAKRKYNCSIFKNCKGDMKKTWKNIDLITNKRKSNNENIIRTNFRNIKSNICDIANQFNDTFKEDIVRLKENKEKLNSSIKIEEKKMLIIQENYSK